MYSEVIIQVIDFHLTDFIEKGKGDLPNRSTLKSRCNILEWKQIQVKIFKRHVKYLKRKLQVYKERENTYN